MEFLLVEKGLGMCRVIFMLPLTEHSCQAPHGNSLMNPSNPMEKVLSPTPFYREGH